MRNTFKANVPSIVTPTPRINTNHPPPKVAPKHVKFRTRPAVAALPREEPVMDPKFLEKTAASKRKAHPIPSGDRCRRVLHHHRRGVVKPLNLGVDHSAFFKSRQPLQKKTLVSALCASPFGLVPEDPKDPQAVPRLLWQGNQYLSMLSLAPRHFSACSSVI